jgi:hypothetical protein
MTLAFLNPTRSFDTKRNAVSFLGHDGMFEIRFFVQAAALTPPETAQAGPGTPETCLSAFDLSLASIQEAARRAYAKHRDDAYTLTPADFR